MVESPGYGLRGDAPNGDYVPPAPLGTITFAGVADGSAVPLPLVSLAGTFQIQNEELRATGTRPPSGEGYAWIIAADAEQSDGVISAIYNANGGFGDEAGIMIRAVDQFSFFDIINLDGTIALVDVTDNVAANTLGTYAIPAYNRSSNYFVEVACWGASINVFVGGVLAISATSSVRQSETHFGFKYAGTTLGIDNIKLPNSYVDPVTTSKIWVAGHSLFTHDGVGADTYTRAGEWLGLIAAEDGTQFAGGGEFGQIEGANGQNDLWSSGAPTSSALAFSNDTYVAWPSGTWADQDWSHIIIMPSNFQYLEDATLRTPGFTTFIDYVRAEIYFSDFVMHMHWHEPGVVSMTTQEFQTYKDFVRSEYMTWYQTLVRDIQEQRPNVLLRVAPVGPVVFDCVDNLAFLSGVTFSDLFMDDAGHGTQTMYFLTALVFYRVMYGTNPDLTNFTFPAGATQILQSVRDNLPSIVGYVQTRLDHYHNNVIEVY